MKTKICTVCKEELPASRKYFPISRSRTGGLEVRCRDCYNKALREHYKENKEQVINNQEMYLKGKKEEYALYKGEELLGIGTIKELAEEFNVQARTIYIYGTEAYKRRLEERGGGNNSRVLTPLDD